MKKAQQKIKEQGTVLIIAVVTSVLLMGVMVSLIEVSYAGHHQVKSDVQLAQNMYLAEGASEHLRVELVNDYRQSRMTLRNWLEGVRSGDRFAGDENYSGHDTTTVAEVSALGSGAGWIDTNAIASLSSVASADNGSVDLRSTSVGQRISFGSADIFNLAFLSSRTDCMFCHLQVDGDVGSLDFFRPGWGIEGSSGRGSGTGSTINGNVYVAANVSMDDTDLDGDPSRVNGTEVTGDIEVNYAGPKLPADLDGDGAPDFPTINPDVARLNASGALSGGSITGITEGGHFRNEDDREALTSIDSTHEGNLVLVGTTANPIHIEGNVFVSGDVIVKGVVTGRGALYSGRNVYVAGDLGYANGPREPSSGEDPDEVAQENIEAEKDEWRLAARSNVVLGNYTNVDDEGNSLPIKDRQEEDFFRTQFNLYDDGFFDHTTGQELKRRDQKFYDDQGNVIPYENVVQSDKYDATLKPAYVKDDGTTDLWLTDQEYREILGTQELKDNTYRMNLKGGGQEVVQTLLDNGFTQAEIDTLRPGWNDQLAANLSGDLVGPDYNITLKKVNEGLHHYPDQVERVDAFLYSNRRIAGKTSGTNLSINGGMISQEIGILAPGRRKFGWMGGYRFDYLTGVGERANPRNGELYQHLAVNYDYRLRNGGFGFDLVQGNVGRRLAWIRNERSAELEVNNDDE